MNDSDGLIKFTKLEKIGEGSFGEVYKARDEETNEIYAIKVFNVEFNNNSDYLNVLFREVELYSKFNHPSIVPFFSFSYFGFDDEQRPAIVIKYAPNGSLDHIIHLEKQNPYVPFWDNTKILCNIYGIASALAYLHAHNIVHLDLKPANILLDEYLFPLVCDFGLSKILDKNQLNLSMSASAGVRGTTTFMAPEIWNNEKYTTACDVYSFALVVFSILTNEDPFINYNVCQFFMKVINNGQRPELSQKIPDAFKNLITKCWAEIPEERPSFKDIVKELAENPDFLVDGVDIDKYHKYVELINQYQTSFDSNDKCKKHEDIMKNFFEKVNINEAINKKPEMATAFESLFNDRIEDLKKLPLMKQETIKNIIFNEDKKVNFIKVHIASDQIDQLFIDETLDSPYLINILKFFQNISIDVQFLSNNYQQIMMKLTKIKTRIIKRIEITIIASNVNAIGNEFKNNAIINNMIIKPPVSFIEAEAFRGCISLRSVTIPSTVKTIENSTFRICGKLEIVTILANLTKIGADAFRGNSMLKKIVFPSSVKEIGESCFRGDSILENVALPENLLSIEVSVFQSCISLREIVIPPHVTVIKSSAFEECVKLSKITIPCSVENVENDAFKCCVELKSVTFDPMKTKIEKNAFRDCSSLWILFITSSNSSCSIEIEPFPHVKGIVINPNITSIANPLPGIAIIESITSIGGNNIDSVPMSADSIGRLGYESTYNT